MTIKKNDVVQIVDDKHPWNGCLLQVKGVRNNNTVSCFMKIKGQKSQFILNEDQCRVVGMIEEEV